MTNRGHSSMTQRRDLADDQAGLARRASAIFASGGEPVLGAEAADQALVIGG